MSPTEDDENLNQSSSDGEFSDPLCVDVPTEGDSSSPSMNKGTQIDAAAKAETRIVPARKKLQQWLAFYVKFCSSAGNQDKLLKVLQWSLWLLANTTTARGKVMTASSSNKSPNQRWMGAISDELSWARYVTRLLGLPVAVEAAANDSWTLHNSSSSSSSNNKSSSSVLVYRAIGKILSYSMVAYHPLEMLAYLQWKKPVSAAAFNKSKWHQPERWSYLSCRFWLAYTAAELTQCILHWRELQKQKRLLEEAKKNDSNSNEHSKHDHDDTTTTTSIRELDAQIANTQLQTARDALFLLPCIHWSLSGWDTKPWLRPHTVNALMWAESIVSLYQAVKNQL